MPGVPFRLARICNINPQEMLVISYGLEGDTMRRELKEGQYCKVALAMFPEIVGKTCVEAGILASNAVDMPEVIETPYAILTQENFSDYYALTNRAGNCSGDILKNISHYPSSMKKFVNCRALPCRVVSAFWLLSLPMSGLKI